MAYAGCAPGWLPDYVEAAVGGRSVAEQVAAERARYEKEQGPSLNGSEPEDDDEPDEAA